MGFNLNYRKLWESLKSEVSLMPFKEANQNERVILRLAAEVIIKKMEELEKAQEAEYKKAMEFFGK